MSQDPEKPLAPPDPPDDDEPADNPFGLLPVLVIVILIVGGLYVAFRLRDSARIQDCVWAGRKNCAPIDPSNP
jgi:hypothetical protein